MARAQKHAGERELPHLNDAARSRCTRSSGAELWAERAEMSEMCPAPATSTPPFPKPQAPAATPKLSPPNKPEKTPKTLNLELCRECCTAGCHGSAPS